MRGVVYFIRAGSSPAVKVGYANCLERRLETLQCGNHLELRVLATIAGSRKLEGAIHTALGVGGWRIRNEWFEISPVVWEVIQGINDGSLGAENVVDFINDKVRQRWEAKEARLQEFLVKRRLAELEGL